ncbi:hypothetical protein MKR66_09120 [Acinetobacter baumannii]
MKKLAITLAVLIPLSTYSFANDSTGYVGTGGIQYLKMHKLRCKVRIYLLVKKSLKSIIYIKT